MALRFLTAGESHGPSLVGILEGMPAGLTLSLQDLHTQLKRRKLGFGRGARQQIETDAVDILAGVRLGSTLGSPIAILLPNRDWDNWRSIMQVEPGNPDTVQRKVDVPRPGHADRVGGIKYDHADMRNVLERASARETAMRVALGSVARKFLQVLNVHVASRVVQIGAAQDSCVVAPHEVATLNQRSDASPVRCLSSQAQQDMVAQIEQARDAGDTLGGVFEVICAGVPMGLGSYSHWDRRIEGQLGGALLALNAIKAVEVGHGAQTAGMRGSAVHDALVEGSDEVVATWSSNRAGGIEGGMTTGQPLVVRATMKPLSTLAKPLPSVHLAERRTAQAHVERSDICAVPAAAVVAESLVCLCLATAVLEKFGGDAMSEIIPRVDAWRQRCASR